jgi:hypothetical protein
MSQQTGGQIRFGLCSRSGFTSQLLENIQRRQDASLNDLAAIMA